MSTLKYAILGLLNQKSMTGYELTREFNTSVCEFWNASHSQIYPELRQLTEAGMVEYEIEIAGTSLEKKLYTITENGRNELMKWLKKHVKMKPTPRDEFRLQLFFSDNLPPQERLELLQHQLAQHRERLAHLLNNQKKFTGIPDTDTAEFGDYLVLMGAVMREETICKWLGQCIAMCQSGKEPV